MEVNFTKLESFIYFHPFLGWFLLLTAFLILFCIIVAIVVEKSEILTIIVVVCAIGLGVYLFMFKYISIYDNINQKVVDVFNQMEYTEDIETTYIYSFNMISKVNGEIKGDSYLGYGRLYGKITEDDFFNFLAKNEDGSYYYDSIPYAKGNVRIWELDGEIPRIEKHNYSKKLYKSQSEYYDYDIYLPIGSLGVQ